jgi:ABC-type Fe3+/spermidine/putrescine transport system ATPase subunit
MSLEAIGLSKRYGNFEVKADLRAEEGETLVLAGPSGCGKTTLLRLIAGLVASDGGTVRISGVDLGSSPPWERGIGFVFQDLALFPHLTVGGNVAFGPFLRGIGRAERGRIVEERLRSVRLEGFAKRRVHTLSGGERQRTAIARALAASPRALLMDEPFSSLDAPLRRSLREEFTELRKRADSRPPCVFVTHDREEAAALGDRIALMDRGRIVEEGPPRVLFLSPKTAFAARFLGSGTVVPVGTFRTAGPPAASSGYSLLVPPDALEITEAGAEGAERTALVVRTAFEGERTTAWVELSDGLSLAVSISRRVPPPLAGRRVGLRARRELLGYVEGS